MFRKGFRPKSLGFICILASSMSHPSELGLQPVVSELTVSSKEAV